MADLAALLCVGFLVVFVSALTPYMVTSINAINMALWTFPAHETIAQLLPIFPYIMIVVLIAVLLLIAIFERD
jgi:hypothetical protein